MAPQITKTVDEATDQAVALIEQAQDAAVAVVAQVSDAVSQYLPEIGLATTATEGALLRPEEVVEASFKVSNKFIDAGRKAALGFIGAVAPVTDKLLGSKKPAKAPSKTA